MPYNSSTTYEWELRGWRMSGNAYMGERSSMTYSYNVRRKDLAVMTQLDITTMQAENVIPLPNVDAYAPGTTGLSLELFMTFDGYETTLRPDGTLDLNVVYSTLYSRNPLRSNRYELPASAEFDAKPRTAQIYRKAWGTNPPAALDETAADIGGTQVGGATQSIDCKVTQVRIRMKFMQDAGVVSVLTAATNLSSYAGKTNSDTFFGCAPYSLVCEGVSIGTVHKDMYEVVFEFLFDEWYHHDQVPSIDVDGRPLRSGGGTGLADVRWRRPNRATAPFNNIYGGDTILRACVEKGTYA